MKKILQDEPFVHNEGILHHEEGVDIIPTNIELSGMEISLVNAMSREQTLKLYLADLKKDYDYILIACMPSLGMLTINALAAADNAGKSSEDGIWFGTSEPDDSKGALLYDTYEIEELSCESNKGMKLIPAFEVVVSRNKVKIDLGTLTDEYEKEITIHTTATDKVTGEKVIVAGKKITIVDTVTLDGLEEPVKVAEHKDIDDEGQTVTIKEVPETPTPEIPGNYYKDQ